MPIILLEPPAQARWKANLILKSLNDRANDFRIRQSDGALRA
jgi:hypothetical protein